MTTITDPTDLEEMFKDNYDYLNIPGNYVTLGSNELTGVKVKMSCVDGMPYLFVEVDGIIEFETETVSMNDAEEEYKDIVKSYFDDDTQARYEYDNYEVIKECILDSAYSLISDIFQTSPESLGIDEDGLENVADLVGRFVEDFYISKRV